MNWKQLFVISSIAIYQGIFYGYDASAGNHKKIVSLAKPNPETLLIDVYKELGNYNLNAAQKKIDLLVATYPNFRLGHLIQGDLLLMHTRAVASIGDGIKGNDDKLRSLQQEAIVRLRSYTQRPDQDLVPKAVLQLRNDQKFVFIVDASRSRLYVYQNLAGQLKFSADYYISQGRLGINKTKEGDQKTPIGVYYITSRLSAARLPDFYGSGALPINYPNEWDRLNGRSGSGIWLHGTPSDSFSRPPLSSDGCVVLTNPDLHRISESVEVGKTPVIISNSVEFVTKTKSESDRNEARSLLDNWHRNMESFQISQLAKNYSHKFKSVNGEDLNVWLSKNILRPTYKSSNLINLRDVSFFLYPGQQNLLVGTFTQEWGSGKNFQKIRKRQYWEKENNEWKIVYEANL